ncbi:BTAD domain-containing putative transcriptional regulator [Mycobacterium sp. Z3061]|uniref:BTAD domain-containing putative transcriptional regulator n=1 Tax=Mycobacterium sp. Z3061 TaxID=3073562 RepID=UPI002872C4C7|nr:BTAD domain-containing putative transcriptional regulator [Mycobacterium sp. Z3061]
MELGVLGPLQVRQAGAPVVIPGAKPRALLTMLGLHNGALVPAETLLELLWGTEPPRTVAKALQTHISALRRTLGEGLVLTEGTGWKLAATDVDATAYRSAARRGREAVAAGDMTQAVARFDEALALWRGVPELPESRRGTAERTRWIEGHAALVEDRADALLATGRAAEIIGELETAVADAPLRERRWGQLMLALYRAGRQGEAIGAYRRARTLLAEELGIEPGAELRRLETAIIAQDTALEVPGAQDVSSVMRAVTFLLTDIEGSTAAWEADAVAMATALARHDELVEQIVTSRGGRLIKTRGEGDATFSVFDRPSSAAAAALELQDAIAREPWALADPMRIRVALHTGEAELRDGDYFGRAVNRAARLRSLAAGGQILCSGASAELVIDSLPDDVALTDLGMRQLRNLARPEHVFELRLHTTQDRSARDSSDLPLQRPPLPTALAGPGPFVGRASELERLFADWQSALTGGVNAVLIAGEPGVGKTRLAGEWSRLAFDHGAIVIYGRCDEDLGAPYQPFAEAMRSLVPCLGAARLRGLRGVEALLALVPGLAETLPELTAPTRADPDTERYALFDAVVALLRVTSASTPVVLILDDLHWAAKPTLLLLRHVLRFGDQARVQIIGTYRSTDLDRTHPLAAMLAHLHRDGTAHRLQLGGLDEDDVSAYVAEAGYDDEDLARALASVTGGNPFFLIEALRHVDESGGHWDANTLPQGVREAVSRRLSRLPAETNKALAAAAVVGSSFAVDLVEHVVGQDLVDAFDQAAQAGIVIEEPGGRYRFNHAIVRQSLLAELASVRRMRLHQRIAATLEAQPGAGDELLAELAYHFFECAWAGNAVKAVDYCRRAADQAMARLGYEGAAELYDQALHALQEIDEELPDRSDQTAELLIARCEALLAAGDVASAAGAVSQLHSATADSDQLAAWATCFEGQLAMLIHPERLDEIEVALGSAAEKLAGLHDAAGEAKAHTVRAGCLARLGRIGDCEAALDDALTAARRARDHRRVNAVLAGAPLAALWGPNPVARAGGRCLDVVRLLRITNDSPVVEATSMRCQAVLEAFRGRTAAARRMIDAARRTITDLGLRHALLEVEQFAGIVELVVDDPAAAEAHLRLAYNGFRRMGLDADSAETAALLGRTCLALGREGEADELCTESERLAGHALKPSIAWRTLRAELLCRADHHDEAGRIAQAAVDLADRTDLFVDHGDACLILATVLRAAGNATEAHAAAERAVGLYERKGAAALTVKARDFLVNDKSTSPASAIGPSVDSDNACITATNRVAELNDIHSRMGGSQSTTRHLANAASRVADQVQTHFAAREWTAMSRLMTEEVSSHDRRRVVNSGNRIGWDGMIQDALSNADLGVTEVTSTIVATRGERLALRRGRYSDVARPSSFYTEVLSIYEIDRDGRISAVVNFDLDNFTAAVTELDARYLAGEAAAYASTWSAIIAGVAALNRHELPSTTADFVNIDHRRVAAYPTGEVIDYVRAGWDLEQNIRTYIEVVHRLSDVGAVYTHVAQGNSRDGLAAEWRGVSLVMVDHHLVSRSEVFDEEDLDAALAKFDQLSRPAATLTNPASRAYLQVNRYYTSGDWVALSNMLAPNIVDNDRRSTVSAGVRRGRDVELTNSRALAEIGADQLTSVVIATRGERLTLCRSSLSGKDERPGGFRIEFFSVVEIDDDQHLAAHVAFDPEDFASAAEELDARFLAGEAARHAPTWLAITETFAALNRRELPQTTDDWVNIDHRQGTFIAAGQISVFMHAAWEVASQLNHVLVAVNRLTDLGAVVTYMSHETSQEGFTAEWRAVILFTYAGKMVTRCEVFDEEDLDAALAKFDSLQRNTVRIHNAASDMGERYLSHFAAGEFDAMAGLLADDFTSDDRRSMVGAGVQGGRDAQIADMRAAAGIWSTAVIPAVLATRGDRLALERLHFSHGAVVPEAFVTEVLGVIEISARTQIVAVVFFEFDDIDHAFAELENRYLAGEAAAHAKTWSLVVDAYAALNRHELPTVTTDWVDIDHRHVVAVEEGDLGRSLRAVWDLAPEATIRIEAVHRLSARGAVVTHFVHARSREGLDAEWREISLLMFDGDQFSRCEVFSENKIDAAIARFDDLHSRPKPLASAAIRAMHRLQAHFAARDWAAVAGALADDICTDDRRRVVNGGIRHGRDAEIDGLRAAADVGTRSITSTPLAIRGERLLLGRFRFSAKHPSAFHSEILGVAELDADNRGKTLVVFDVDDVDAAFAELDARYLAGEAAPYAHTWSVISRECAAFNRHEPPAAEFVTIDHRRLLKMPTGNLIGDIEVTWDLMPDVSVRIESVYRLTHLGAVAGYVAQGTSPEGFDAEWRITYLVTIDGERISRCEIFDEADLDAALARFDELMVQDKGSGPYTA